MLRASKPCCDIWNLFTNKELISSKGEDIFISLNIIELLLNCSISTLFYDLVATSQGTDVSRIIYK